MSTGRRKAAAETSESFVVIAHRGDSLHFPENTLPAFAAAVIAGADMIELDISITADGFFVVIHDDTLSRTTKEDGFVCHRTAEELKTLDAARWFTRKEHRSRLPGLDRMREVLESELPLAAKALGLDGNEIHVPTLDQALETIGPDTTINIEIKPFFPLNEAGRMQAALSRLVTLLSERGRADRIILSSTNFFLLEYCRELNAEIRLGIIYRRPLTDFDPLFVARAFGAYSIHPWHRQVTTRFIETMHGAGLKVYPYTVNDAARQLELRDMGADGIFTDDPGAALKTLGRKAPRATPPAKTAVKRK